MRPFWKPGAKDEPPPTESAGELERIPRRAVTGTATQQLHLRLTLERDAAGNLRRALERDRKRVVEHDPSSRLMASLCVDVASLDLQSYTGSIHVCSCDAFETD